MSTTAEVSETQLKPTALALAFVFGAPVGMAIFSVLGLAPAVGGFLAAALVLAGCVVARHWEAQQEDIATLRRIRQWEPLFTVASRSTLTFEDSKRSDDALALVRRLELLHAEFERTLRNNTIVSSAASPMLFSDNVFRWIKYTEGEGKVPVAAYLAALDENLRDVNEALVRERWAIEDKHRSSGILEARLAFAALVSSQLAYLLRKQ